MAENRRPSDDDLRRYLVARADAAARLAGGDMVERVAARAGLVRGGRRARADALRVAVAAAALLAALLAIGVGSNLVAPPTPSPTPGPTRDPSATPATLLPLPAAAFAGAGQIAADATAVWVADRSGRLTELDPATGAAGRNLVLPRPASDLLLTADSVWVSSDSGDLVRVDRSTLAITPVSGAVGIALAEGSTGIWLGGSTEVVRVDPSVNAVTLRVPIAERSADLGVAATNGAVWVATRTQILRLDPSDGRVVSSIAGDAARLAASNGAVWATRGTELVRIDATRGEATAFLPGFPGGTGFAASADHLWAGGPPGGGGSGTILGASSIDGWIELRGALSASVLDIAVGAGAVWVTPDEDVAGTEIYRFATP